ncbi:MAG: hypothetical protein DA407_02895 [Bacteroidetes bacterium]|nr:MAG: hypothetical protein DA407_02895 [Bacteroidota bacterium]
MFKTKEIINKNPRLNHIHVFNDDISCKICPNLGGSIQEFSHKNIDILDGIEFSEKGLKSYAEAYQSAILFPFVGRIPNGKYAFENRNYKLETNETYRNNALHGLVFNKSFKIDVIHTSNLEVKVQLSFVSDGTLKGYPFKFKLQITYSISNNGLTINFNITNQDSNSFPCGCGWHPYFKSENLASSSLSFLSNEKLSCDDNLIPNVSSKNPEPSTFTLNHKSFDDTFILLKNEVNFKSNKYKLQMVFNENHQSYLQIYTPFDRKNIAIEPVTSAPNAFNNKLGLLELKPNKTYNWNIKLKIIE